MVTDATYDNENVIKDKVLGTRNEVQGKSKDFRKHYLSQGAGLAVKLLIFLVPRPLYLVPNSRDLNRKICT